jgi:hypothetical protein
MTRHLSLGIALLVLPVGAAACGGGGKGSTTGATDAASVVQAAVAKTAKAGGEHAVLTASVKAAGQSVTLSGTGDFDSAKQLGKLQASITLAGVDTKIEEVLSGSTIYVSTPLFAAVLPGGKTWLKVDLANPPKSLGAYATALGTQDPAAALAQLKALTGVQEAGSQTIAGVDSTRYRRAGLRRELRPDRRVGRLGRLRPPGARADERGRRRAGCEDDADDDALPLRRRGERRVGAAGVADGGREPGDDPGTRRLT